MIIPNSIAEAHERQAMILDQVADVAGNRLRNLCKTHSWLYDERHKSLESAMAKLEAGSSSSLAHMHDLWAAMVVVPTLAEVPAATEALLTAFDGEPRLRRSTDARAFAYDDVHIIASLGSKVSDAVKSQEVRARPFEIQIHTGLQYAWWRATHDIYKTARGDWRTLRAASQARASLELLDGVLANLHGAGELQVTPAPEPEPDALQPLIWLDLWRPTDQPTDQLRFCQTSINLSRACGLSLSAIESYLHSDLARELTGQRDLTPGQTVTIVTARLTGDEYAERLVRAESRILVTAEMLRYEPSLGRLPEAVVSHP